MFTVICSVPFIWTRADGSGRTVWLIPGAGLERLGHQTWLIRSGISADESCQGPGRPQEFEVHLYWGEPHWPSGSH